MYNLKTIKTIKSIETNKQKINKTKKLDIKTVISNIERHPVPVLGKDFRVKLNYKNIKIIELNVCEDTINILLPKKYKNIENEKILDLAIMKMYEQIANIEIEVIMEKVRLMMGFAPEDYIIKYEKGVIANCINSKITINPEIVMYDKNVIEYIIIHQYCHLKYKNHCKSFIEMIEKLVPNYKKYEKILKNKY